MKEDSRSELVVVKVFPTNEIPSNSSLEISVKISNEIESVNQIKFLANREGEQPSIIKILEKTKEENNYEEYRISVRLEKLGNYFFFFIIIINGKEKSIKLNRQTNKPFITNPETESPYWRILVINNNFNIPEWSKDAIFYQIFIDRFYKSEKVKVEHLPNRKYRNWGEMPNWHRDEFSKFHNNDFFGGNLKGIEEKIGYIKSLGVSVIYISPINESGSRYERYASTDHMKLDPEVGTFEDLASLHKKANDSGMHIVLDIAFNHCSSDNLKFQDALNNPDSKYRDWFKFDENGNYEYWYGIFKDMPLFNQHSQGLQDYIYGENGVVALFSQYVDGFRLDLAEALEPFFLEGIRNRARKNELKLIVGEYWEKADINILGKGIDCPTNYLYTNAILKFVAYGEYEYLEWQIKDILENYPKNTINTMLNSISTHDMVRALTILGGKKMRNGYDRIWEIDKEPSQWHVNTCEGKKFLTDEFRKFENKNDKLNSQDYELAKKKLKVAVILQYFSPGNACIFYGDEVGLHGYKDPFNRKCYPWGNEDKELLSFYREIGNFRNHFKGADSSFKVLYADNEVFIFERKNKTNKLFVAVNRGENQRQIQIPEEFRRTKRKMIFKLSENYVKENYLLPYGGIVIVILL